MDAKSIQQLKMFVQACKMNPELLHEPSLSFFKTYIESLGATIPAKEEAPEEAPKAEEKPVPEPKAPEPAPMEVESEEEEEVVELDNSGVIDEDKLIDLPMGEEDKECSEADMDQANELRGQGQMAMMDGNLDKARDIYGKAILANPHSAPLFAKRAQLLLRQKKPRNVIRDCDKALVINPDNALAHRCKGKALRLLGKWEEAASSLGAAQKIDYDDDTHEMMNTIVKPNADKLRAARLRREGKRRERDHKERAERVKSAREERQKAYDEQKKQRESQGPTFDNNMNFEPEDMGAPPGGMGGLFEDPEIQELLQDPEVIEAMAAMQQNPASLMQYMNNPKVKKVLSKLQGKFGGGGMGGMPGGMGGMPGGMGGMPGGMGGMPGGMGGMPGGMGGMPGGMPPGMEGMFPGAGAAGPGAPPPQFTNPPPPQFSSSDDVD